jgi:hypothetical protein
MSDQANYGIIGDVKNVQNLAEGSNARIDATNVQPQLAGKLDALAGAVEDYEGPEETQAELLAAHDDLVTQLQQPQPDKSRILETLSTVARSAGSASAIVIAATTLASAVQTVL